MDPDHYGRNERNYDDEDQDRDELRVKTTLCEMKRCSGQIVGSEVGYTFRG
jgi:hypothetical protein